MKTLSVGAVGPQVQLLQLALERAGFSPGPLDGSFGQNTKQALLAFQRSALLRADGVAGPVTHRALTPWYAGYMSHTIRRGDSFYRLALRYGTTVRAIAAANPELDPLRLPVGASIVVPLGFDVVPTSIDWCSELVGFCCSGIAARYPGVVSGEIGTSVLGTPLCSLSLGRGRQNVLYNGTHHANEWITTPILLKFTERLARADAFDLGVYDRDAKALLNGARLTVIPCVNPDGMDLVTGSLRDGADYETARAIAADYPEIPFPSGWKANIRGVDLNLQYPAGWETAREIKFSQGFVSPAPRDYVGAAALSAPESLALYQFTLNQSPSLTLSYHTQGGVIYWKYLDYDPPGAYALAKTFSEVSSYAVETTPYASAFAGYKDWFIQNYVRPGYTIEAGRGANPLPITQFDRIYRENFGILTLALSAAAEGQN